MNLFEAGYALAQERALLASHEEMEEEDEELAMRLAETFNIRVDAAQAILDIHDDLLYYMWFFIDLPSERMFTYTDLAGQPLTVEQELKLVLNTQACSYMHNGDIQVIEPSHILSLVDLPVIDEAKRVLVGSESTEEKEQVIRRVFDNIISNINSRCYLDLELSDEHAELIWTLSKVNRPSNTELTAALAPLS